MDALKTAQNRHDAYSTYGTLNFFVRIPEETRDQPTRHETKYWGSRAQGQHIVCVSLQIVINFMISLFGFQNTPEVSAYKQIPPK